jgi:hypothetical protein
MVNLVTLLAAMLLCWHTQRQAQLTERLPCDRGSALKSERSHNRSNAIEL